MPEVAKHLSKLIQFETVSSRSDPRTKQFEAFFTLLKQQYPAVFKKCERIPLQNALLLCWRGETRENPTVLMAHCDVVDAGGGWSVPPFSGTIQNGTVYGRGTADNKGALCAIFEAVNDLIAEEYAPAGDIYLLSTTDEEIITGSGAANAVRYFRDSCIKPLLVLDEGGVINDYFFKGMERPFAFIGIAEKSYVDIALISKGAGGHSSVPGNYVPVVSLAKTVCTLQKKRFRNILAPAVISMLKAVAPDVPKRECMLFSHPKLLSAPLMRYLKNTNAHIRAMLHTTCAFTMMSGSAAPNILPKEASVTANLRLLPGENLDMLYRRWKRYAAKHDVKVRLLSGGGTADSANSAADGYTIVSEAVRKTNPRYGIAPYMLVGATDSRHFSAICDNVIKFSPFYFTEQQDAAMHGKDENISIESLLEGIEFYKNLIRGLNGKQQ